MLVQNKTFLNWPHRSMPLKRVVLTLMQINCRYGDNFKCKSIHAIIGQIFIQCLLCAKHSALCF